MLYTQLFRGPTSVASYPSFVFEELFKLQTISAEPESTEITIPDPTRLGLPELDGVTSTTAININGEAVNFSPAPPARFSMDRSSACRRVPFPKRCTTPTSIAPFVLRTFHLRSAA